MAKNTTGEIQGSYCLSEPDAGSDVAAMRARAVRDGDVYVLNGTKYWISNAGISDVYIVFAKTDPDAGARNEVENSHRNGSSMPIARTTMMAMISASSVRFIARV